MRHRMFVAVLVAAVVAGWLLWWPDGEGAARGGARVAHDKVLTTEARVDPEPPTRTTPPTAPDLHAPHARDATKVTSSAEPERTPASAVLAAATAKELVGDPLRLRRDLVEVVLVHAAEEPLAEPWSLWVSGDANALNFNPAEGCVDAPRGAAMNSRNPVWRYRSRGGSVRVPYFGLGTLYALASGRSFAPKAFVIPRDALGEIPPRHVERVFEGARSVVSGTLLLPPELDPRSLAIRLLPCFESHPSRAALQDGVVPTDGRKTLGPSDFDYQLELALPAFAVTLHGLFDSGCAQVIFGDRVLWQSALFSLPPGGQRDLGVIALPPFRDVRVRYAVDGRIASNYRLLVFHEAIAGVRPHREAIYFGPNTLLHPHGSDGIRLPLAAMDFGTPLEMRVHYELTAADLAHFPPHTDDLYRIRTALSALVSYFVGARPHRWEPGASPGRDILLQLTVEDIASLIHEPAFSELLTKTQSILRPHLADHPSWRWLFADPQTPRPYVELIQTALGCL